MVPEQCGVVGTRVPGRRMQRRIFLLTSGPRHAASTTPFFFFFFLFFVEIFGFTFGHFL
jgi:hypothetical protein